MKNKFTMVMSFLIFYLIISCNESILLSQGQVWSGSGVHEKPKEGNYRVEFFGDIELGSSGMLSDAVMKGKGQATHKNMLITSGVLESISNSEIKLSIDSIMHTFTINSNTIICDGKRRIRSSSFKVGEFATVCTKLKGGSAVSLRKGPMLYKGVGGPLKLYAYTCL